MVAPTPPHGSPPTPPSDSPGRSEPPPQKPDPDKLSDEIAELAAHIDAARYRLLVLIRQFAELERWGPGFKSCDHWLSWRVGIALPTAREHVRVARALAELPLLSAAMERGEISFSRARAITRVATPANEQRLVGFALQATAMQLEHLVKAWRKVDRLEDEQVRHERRHLTLYADEDGSYVLRGRLDPEVGELFARAMDAARSTLYREKEERTRLETSPVQRGADALGLVAEWALGSSVLPDAAWPDAEEKASGAGDGNRQDGARAEGAGGGGEDEAGDVGVTGTLGLQPRRDGGGGDGVQGGNGRTEATGAAEQSESERQDAVPPTASGRGDASDETENVARGRKADVSDETENVARGRKADASAETENAARGKADVSDETENRARGKADVSDETEGRARGHKGKPAKRTKRPARPKTANRSDRFLVVMHVDQEGVRVPGTGQATGPRSSLAVLDGKGVGVSDETCRRLACDGSVVVMTHAPDGSVLDVGRKRRTIPPAIRRAVDYRDGGCRFPGCGLRIIDNHHLDHWIDGGKTKVDNVFQLCRHHHRLVHEGGFRMEVLKNGGTRFYWPDGRLVPNTAPRPRVEGDAEKRLRRESDQRGLDIGPWTATPDWHGERLDLHFGLWTLRGQYADQEEKDTGSDDGDGRGRLDGDISPGHIDENDDEGGSGLAA